MSNLKQITDANFEETVLSSGTPFLLDMAAEWCGPCKAIAPVVEELASEFEGKVGFGQVDVDANPQIPTNYQVRAIPTLLIFKDGEVVGQLTGAHPKAKIKELIESAL